MRLHLTSKGAKKLVVAHFKSVVENPTKALKVVDSAVRDIRKNDFSTILGLVEHETTVRAMMRNRKGKVTWF